MKQRAVPYILAAPAVILLMTFGIFPILVAAVVSFTDLDVVGLADMSKVAFVGFDNYANLFHDPDFWKALANTGLFVVFGVPAIVICSLGVALALNSSNGRFMKVLRSFYFVPAITGIVAISLVWGYLYNAQFGLFNWILTSLGADPLPWLSDPALAKFSVALVAIWRGTGLNIIIFLAALQGIPQEYREAAAIDGAGRWRTTVSIVIPLLRFALFFVTVTTMIAWLQFFDEPFVLTDGGPLGATTSASIFLYKHGIRLNQFGYASAGSLILLAVIAAVTVLQLRVKGKDDDV
ncbi:MAG: sugar ABC transporter permease [Propionibacteriaceae bacterium]|jgi:multiple sugar transport system permease protein|nr:sugar ABC transporter permease [Propionibacteriaceae bacterium]